MHDYIVIMTKFGEFKFATFSQ